MRSESDMRRMGRKLTIVISFIIALMIGGNALGETINRNDTIIKPIKVAVVVYDTAGAYISQVINNLKDIQKKNEGKVEFEFCSSNKDQFTQNEIIDTKLKNKEVKLLIVELVDLNAPKEVINRAKEYNIPIVLISREPPNKDSIKSYGKSIFIGTALEQAGVLEGEALVDIWNKNKYLIDKNKDNIMQYIIFNGPSDNLEAVARAKYSVLTINNAGIKMKQIASICCDWSTKDEAKKRMGALLLQCGTNNVEAIIATNDNMAIGIIEALQAMGYNNGGKERTIPVVGVDGIPEAGELIKKGFMAGTVVQDAQTMAEAAYITGMNLVEAKKPLDGTNYKFDESGATIRIPYKRYVTD
ncbi:galactose ABC transporter substrate-binding protein [Clostridium beijerinckii]|uniref:D-galactose/methyl-galactoside binding periplasmic protein MglB n=3 Tax=Clostridium beijerinckii TaxID=1520 RepID=A0A9Q5CS02_CLOBE|nr:galactose ABC transporter substrate-binding protein [Clostridium beijerinckii]AQS04982.1 D-galactose-binding periplasmic protein precursor [Clostridium beijerinckii]MBA2885967.1 methyl-galactoside transport system substrate-binding protein [Clostridium beijerinckii]MBA2900744.1 methyl-galactoside transport system substrate-binding protein [Clostridium beijerinckii]MBA2910526.1 methyl-galactoside transport system substrate-binding protein [Clostridium beijerinckii]MBA9015452.1 methyl-galacto